MRKIGTLLGAAALCMGLTSCNFVAANPESLMRPPRLSPLQAEIDEALKNTLGGQEIVLKYPLSGDYRSSYLLHNLDDDPQEEALVFYRMEGEDESIIRMSVLDRKEDGRWAVDYTAIGSGSDVQAVRFAPISNKEREDIIVSWSQKGKESPTVMVYSYEDRELNSIYSGTADAIYLVDSNDDGYQEMLLLVKSGTRDPSVQLVRRVGRRLIARNDALLNPQLIDFAGATFGKTADGRPAIFIDEVVDSRTYATEVVVIEDRRPVNLMAISDREEDLDLEDSLYYATMRPAGARSQDIDGDGTVEIPTQKLLPGYTEDQEGEQLYLTTYHSIGEGELYPNTYAVLNEEMGYALALPTTWNGTVTVKKVHESGEWRFVVYEKNLENSTVELLRIRVSSHQDYQDKFETETYFSLAKKGIFEYYGCIPTANHPLSITQEELTEMFRLTREINN